MSHAKCWGKSIGGRGNGKCDSLEAGVGVQRGSWGPEWSECGEQGRESEVMHSQFPRGLEGPAQGVGLIR